MNVVVDVAPASQAGYRVPAISSSLAPLREVVSSLAAAASDNIPRGRDRQRLVRRARRAGVAALPSLMRALCGDCVPAANWAYYLLRAVGGQRLIDKLDAVLVDRKYSDAVKARALGLLADLKAPLSRRVVLNNPDALLLSSVQELLASLRSEQELRQAVELILGQVPPSELSQFLAEIVRHGGNAAAPLLSALVEHPRTPEAVAKTLAGLVRPMPTAAAQAPAREGRTSERTAHRLASRLEQALNLLREGKLQQARARLEALCEKHQREPEVYSALGLCLLRMEQPDTALDHLERAAELEPGAPLHAWNVAAAAHAARRMGTCYHSLRRYMQLADDTPGAAARRQSADSFCTGYERAVQAEYPNTPLQRVLEGEDLFARAYESLMAAHYDAAIAGFQKVLRLVPQHHPSWGNLGVAYLAQQRTQDAIRCWRRALKLNPNYSLARNNLALLKNEKSASGQPRPPA